MLDADRMIAVNWDTIREAIEQSGVKNDYDVQEYCLITASVKPEKSFDTSSIDRIKEFAFQSGQPVQLYFRVLGIMARDKYLSEKNA